jgi:acetoin utilization deacetylase AcuC-like enzyme
VPQVSYFYDADLGDFYYGPTHPMKPHRVRMAHDLIVRYDLYKHLQVRLLLLLLLQYFICFQFILALLCLIAGASCLA